MPREAAAAFWPLFEEENEMRHRHLSEMDFSLPSIDDIISRGLWADWAALREKALADAATLEDIKRVCRHYTEDSYEQRYHFWMHYAKKHSKTA